ncbi:hypothetical protein [Paenibacillus roseipurpureus]|uniref:Uncharacterized protein n=1 Tax=Paenibacillus roseopurpureus TaxID=2918901 RepID=A0AA96RMP2_9BACL|nr:hypothetical protein [Paenibacillus sp. MBLB1832]WNR46671.1 hypothetical protein MJB10_11450 [Paenibacillus sp. MBLB1832]
MSFKAIDLQFAVHKNDEAGIKQNQLMQKPRQDEAILENQASQATEKDRYRSSKLEESARADIKDRREQKHAKRVKKKRETSATDALSSSFVSESQSSHPYKGHHIDLSL